MAATLELVARAAGVSRATVSRVVNGSTQVSPRVTQRVVEAIERLGYVPNRAARSLASRRTDVVALIVPETTSTVFDDPFFAAFVQGVARFLAETEYTLNLLIAPEASSEKTRRYLLGGGVDGALVVSHHSGDHSYLDLQRSLPIVFGGRPINPELAEHPVVDVDNPGGARIGTEHLIGLGRRRIGTIAGRADMTAGVDRLSGWRDALRAAGLDDGLVEFGDFTPASGAAAMRRLLEREPRLDGLFVANDLMAAGAYPVLRDAGRRIPEDIAIVGFDDDAFAATLSPSLTTLRQPSAELGATLAGTLVRLLAGEDVLASTILPTRLVVRESAPNP
jgi:DNA-binding LacI/PurR family transcriptional regulator